MAGHIVTSWCRGALRKVGLRVTAPKGQEQQGDLRGKRLWQVTVVDIDPEAGKFGRTTEVKVKIAAPVQPLLPETAVPGYPPAVEFTDLVLTPYVDSQKCKGAGAGPHKCRARLAYSIRAGAVIAPQSVARRRAA